MKRGHNQRSSTVINSNLAQKVLCRNRCHAIPAISGSKMGYFDALPLEVMYKILPYLNPRDLISLIHVSSSMRMTIRIYINSTHCVHMKIFRNPHSHPTGSSTKFRQLCLYYSRIGSLLKHLHFSSSLEKRIRFLGEQLQKHMCSTRSEAPSNMELCTCSCFRCPALCLYGHFLHAFTLCWSDADKRKVFHSLVHFCFGENFWKKLTSLISDEPGKDSAAELTARLFLRRVFLDPLALPVVRSTVGRLLFTPFCRSQSQSVMGYWPDSCSSVIDVVADGSPKFKTSTFKLENVSNRAPYQEDKILPSAPLMPRQVASTSNTSPTARPNWPAVSVLTHILHSYPVTLQARLIFILYGPLHKGRLMWQAVCQNTAADGDQLIACFGELGGLFANMLDSSAWTANQALELLNEMIVLPDNWLAENVACLLYAAGSDLASIVIRDKAVHGRVGELAVMLTSLCLVRVKIHATVDDLVCLIGDACRAAEQTQHRRQFLDQLACSFQDVIVDLYQTDDLEDRVEDFTMILKAQTEFTRALMARIYEE